MRNRRALGVLAVLLLANATAGAAVARCLPLTGTATRAASQASESRDASSARHEHGGVPNRVPSGDHRGVQCCLAFGACGATLVAISVVTHESRRVLDARVAPSPILAPRSVFTAPDPPPPKA